jgi:hypothetical protein
MSLKNQNNSLSFVFTTDKPLKEAGIDILYLLEDDERRFSQLNMGKYGNRMETGLLISLHALLEFSYKENEDLKVVFKNKSKMILGFIDVEKSILSTFDEGVIREHILEKTKIIIKKTGALSQKKYTFDADACLKDIEELLSKPAPPRELDFDAPLVSLAEIERCSFFYTPNQLTELKERRYLQIKHGLISEDY